MLFASDMELATSVPGTSAGSPASLLLDSGLSVPREPVGGEPNTELKDQMGQPEVQKSRKVWMDLDEFCICFKWVGSSLCYLSEMMTLTVVLLKDKLC